MIVTSQSSDYILRNWSQLVFLTKSAKNHYKEAQIIMTCWSTRGAVIATNMAGQYRSLVKGFEDFLCQAGCNVMKAVVSITSFVDVQVVKETQVWVSNSTIPLKMTWWNVLLLWTLEGDFWTSQHVWRLSLVAWRVRLRSGNEPRQGA